MRVFRPGYAALLACSMHTAFAAPLTATAFVDAGKTVANQGQVSYYSGTADLYEERFNGNSTKTTAASYYKNCVQQQIAGFVINPLAPDVQGALVQGVQYVGSTGRNPGSLAAIPPGSNAATVRSGGTIANQSCYLAAPGPNFNQQFGPGQPLEIDVTPNGTSAIQYFGFYWGSLDAYNGIQLLSKTDKNGNQNPIIVNGLSDAQGNITGQALMTAFGLKSGQSFYFSLRFPKIDNFGVVEAYSSDFGFEMDNLAYSVMDKLASAPPGSQQIGASPTLSRGIFASPAFVPEPTALSLFGLGIAGLAARRKRR